MWGFSGEVFPRLVMFFQKSRTTSIAMVLRFAMRSLCVSCAPMHTAARWWNVVAARPRPAASSVGPVRPILLPFRARDSQRNAARDAYPGFRSYCRTSWLEQNRHDASLQNLVGEDEGGPVLPASEGVGFAVEAETGGQSLPRGRVSFLPLHYWPAKGKRGLCELRGVGGVDSRARDHLRGFCR